MTAEIGRISEFLLALYRDAHQLRPDLFQHRTLTQMRHLIDFDFGAWGGGAADDREVSDVVVIDQTSSLFTDWSAVATEDAYCGLALKRINHSVMFEDVPDFRHSRAYVEHWGRHDARNMVGTIMAEPVCGYVSFVGLCSADPARRFDEEQRYRKQLLMPHISSALRLCRENWAMRGAAAGEGVAIVNQAGWVLASHPLFRDLMREEWGTFANRLPADILQVCDTAVGQWRGQAIQLRIECFANYYLLRATVLSPLECMTHREQQVAECFAGGLSHKDVARELGIAPSTVRNHLARIYERLGIARKSELVRLLCK